MQFKQSSSFGNLPSTPRLKSKYLIKFRFNVFNFFLLSVKPFPPGAFNLASPPKAATPAPAPPAWIGRSIATHKFRLIEHSAFVEEQRLQDAYHKHLFVHIGGEVDYSDSRLEVTLLE